MTEQNSAIQTMESHSSLESRIKDRQQSTCLTMLKGQAFVEGKDVMKKREDWAVTLRNSKRKEKIVSKRKEFMQMAFMRTTKA